MEGEEQDPEELAHWHEYRVDYLGEIGSVLSRTLGALGIGALIALGTALLIGFAAEESTVADVLTGAGMSEERIETVELTLDYLARMSIAPVMIIGLLSAAGVGLGHTIRDVAVSRAVVQAARDGAPKTAVPTPKQVEAISQTRFTSLRRAFLFGVLPASLVLMPLMFAGLGAAPVVSLVIAAFYATVAVGYFRLRNTFEPRHGHRRIVIAEHWSTEDEQAAWDRARESGGSSARISTDTQTSSTRWRADPRVRIGRLLVTAAIMFGVLSWNILKIYLRVRWPEAGYIENRIRHELGPRAEYSPEVERILTTALVVAVALSAALIIAAIVGNILEGVGRRAERALLTAMIDDPAAPRPPHKALVTHGRRRPAPLAQGLAIFAALLLVYGIPVEILGTFPFDSFPDAVGLFSPFRFPAAITIACGVVLFSAACAWNAHRSIHGRDLRNRIHARWPSTPTRIMDIRDRVVPARVGPALTWRPEQNDPDADIWKSYLR